MAIEGVVNSSDISSQVWQLLSTTLSPITNVIKVVGIVFIVYIIYLIIKGILNYRRNKKVDITYEKVLVIDKKLDELLKKNTKKEKKKN